MTTTGRNVLLAVGGGIAAYKSASLCSRLVQAGYDVRVAMTWGASQFIGAATFAALSGQAVAGGSASGPVGGGGFDPDRFPLGSHIELSRFCDLMVIAPATANLIGKFANGIADDLVTTLYLQVDCPVILAPAMSDPMWRKASVQRNVAQLQGDGCRLIGPESGWLSCRVKGEGRMSEPDDIFLAVQDVLRVDG